MVSAEDLLPIKRTWRRVALANVLWLLVIVVVAALAVATSSVYDLAVRSFFLWNSLLWILLMLVQIVGSLWYLKYRTLGSLAPHLSRRTPPPPHPPL